MPESSEVPKKGITKRRFLETAGATAVGAGVLALVLALGYESMKHTETEIDFSTLGADYRFLGGTHGNEDWGKFNLVNLLRGSDVPSDTTIFEIESGTLDYLNPQIFPELGKVYYGAGEVVDFLREPLKVLTDRKLPMVLTDIPPPSVDPEFLVTIGFTASGIGLALMQRKEKDLTRRKFMLGGAFSFLWGGTLRTVSGDILSFLQRSMSEPWAQKAAKLNHWAELAKPDDLAIIFRNSIIAAKNLGLETQAPVNPQSQKAKKLLLYGSGHMALPEYMKGGKQAILDYLALYPKVFIDKTFGLDNPHLHTSAILTPEGSGEIKIETIEDKDLKAIFK